MNTEHFWLALALGLAFCIIAMGTLWVYATAKRDASIVDVAWAGLLGTLAIVYAALGDGAPERRVQIGVMGGFWGLRLSAYLLLDRVLRASHEDGRYQELRASWGDRANRNFFVFFQAQGLLAAVLSAPFAMAAFSDAPLRTLDFASAAIWLVALLGESLADRQLAAWRRLPSNRGRTSRAGLWRYSRHPNYFFEWLMWCAFAGVASAAPLGWLAWLAPLFMLLLITKVTGIPPTEARALRSRGEDYRRYQRSTNAFFPWVPRPEPMALEQPNPDSWGHAP
ncbi:MAG: DUF1295 domain-containing protein [Phycisphaerales bacterium]|nr:DUF1295 domain-containing protein [Phycisphaerales bacterium]